MITLKNTQRKIAVDTEQIQKIATDILKHIDYPDFDLGIWITNNKTIRTYNRTYRNKDKATDILSFPFHPNAIPGKRIRASDPDEKNLGDLIISAEYLVQEAEKHKMSLATRFEVLLVHGICHLLGYDHIIDADYRRMRGKEAYLLKMIRQEKAV